jgi:uncharacterized OB-fold protein
MSDDSSRADARSAVPSPRRMTTWSKPFWQGVDNGQFLVQESTATGKTQFFPRPYGLEALDATRWRTASGLGSLLAFTICRVPAPGFESQAPYAIGIVKLAEGSRIMAQLAVADHGVLKVGMAVRLRWGMTGSGSRIYLFEPAPADGQRDAT